MPQDLLTDIVIAVMFMSTAIFLMLGMHYIFDKWLSKFMDKLIDKFTGVNDE